MPTSGRAMLDEWRDEVVLSCARCEPVVRYCFHRSNLRKCFEHVSTAPLWLDFLKVAVLLWWMSWFDGLNIAGRNYTLSFFGIVDLVTVAPFWVQLLVWALHTRQIWIEHGRSPTYRSSRGVNRWENPLGALICVIYLCVGCGLRMRSPNLIIQISLWSRGVRCTLVGCRRKVVFCA